MELLLRGEKTSENKDETKHIKTYIGNYYARYSK